MLTSKSTNSPDNEDINMLSLSTSVDCWPTLELALNQLFPRLTELSHPITLTSDDYLKLYTLVFEYCVSGSGGGGGGGKGVKEVGGGTGAGMICGKDMYEAVFHYISHKLSNWAEFIKTEQDPQQVFNHLLKQLDRLQSIEKPLTFIFTYLERHWIDRQINENCDNVLPMKQLIWSQWNKIILRNVLPRIQPVISEHLKAARENQISLEDLEPTAKFVHYLRVISKPFQLESDYKSTKRVLMAGAVVNKRVIHEDQFKEFVEWYCQGIEEDCPKLKMKTIDEANEFIQSSLQFWNEEEGRMAFLRFDKSALITVRNHLKSFLLLPNLDLIKESFKQSIVTWNLSTANTIYRLLANRKSLLLHLDTESQTAFILKGQKLINEELTNQQRPLKNLEEVERLFINLLGRFYNLTTELIQTSFAGRPEIFESRSKAFRQLLNDPPIKNETQRKGFAARSLSKFADFVIRTFPDSIDKNNLQVLMALFRLIDDKDEFQETYGRLLALRLLTSITTKTPSNFETELLNHLKQTCGAFYVNNYERMFGDIQEAEVNDHVTVITGGIWNIKGKLLPGHPLLLNHSDKFSWPEPINSSISDQNESYHRKFPKRKLFWSPVLTCVEFQYTYNDFYSVLVKGTGVHLKILQTLSDDGPLAYDSLVKLAGLINSSSSVPFYIPLVLNSLLASGIVVSTSPGNILHLNSELPRDQDCIDLYTGVISELIGNNSNSNSNGINNKVNSVNSTPRPVSSFAPHSFSNSSQQQQILNSLDKSILLQCAITRILKQLRLLSLPDLFNRISMLPNLLTRFSPSIEEIIEALKQLHEKEFVQLAFGDLDELLDVTESDLKNLSEYHDHLFIKYMA